MERILQYLDDLDDLWGMVGLIGERLRNFLLKTLFFLVLLAVAVGAVTIALVHPPIALATSILLFVTLLYRSVTAPSHRWA